jgi:hypothetical protein
MGERRRPCQVGPVYKGEGKKDDCFWAVYEVKKNRTQILNIKKFVGQYLR